MPFSCSRRSRQRPEGIGESLKSYLDAVADRYEQSDFIADDPISIPHGFDDPADQEVIGLFAALLAWGRRDTLLRKLADLCERMSYRPRRFIDEFEAGRGARDLDGFVHRTFNSDDAVNLSLALQSAIREFGSLENLFARGIDRGAQTPLPAAAREPVQSGLEYFSGTLLAAAPGDAARMRRVLARPSTGSACKRLVMYVRWMVRPGPVDLNLWSVVDRSDLLLPLDVHSGRQARAVGLIDRKSNDWKAVMELTDACCELCPEDPARYDFAFFGTGSAGEELVHPAQ